MKLRIAAFAAAWAFAAHAQDDSVLVSATRFPADVRQLPASTTLITQEDIGRSAARTLPELLGELAGIRMTDFSGNNGTNTSIDLRGYGVTGPQNTLILLDGRRLNDFDLSGVQWAAIPLAGIERIEVLRGTGAVLYGDGASAGVVNIVTRSPLRQGTRIEALARIGSLNTLETQLYGSAANDRLGINGSVYGYGSDGYRRNNRNEQNNATLNLRLALGEGAIDLNLASDRQDVRLPGGRRSQASAGLDEYATDPRGARTPLDYASRDGARLGLNWTQRIGEAELSAGFSFRNKDQRSYFDQSGFPAYRADNLDHTSLTPRARIPFTTGSIRHSLTVGMDHHAWRYGSQRTNVPENLSRPTNLVRVRQDSTAFYAQDLIRIAQATSAQIGWRSERARTRGTDLVAPTAPGCGFPPCAGAAPLAVVQQQDAWEAGLRQGFGSDWTAYGRLARSFRLMNAEEFYDFDAFGNPEFQALRPQRSLTREAGVEWRTARRYFRTGLFHTDVRDEIHLDPFTAGVGNTNLPPSRRQGLEMEGRWQAGERLRLSASYAYTDARFLEGFLPGGPFVIGTNLPLAGRRVPLVPEHKLNLTASFEVLPATRLSSSLTSLSSQVFDNDESNTLGRRIPSFAVLDLKLTHQTRAARFAVAVNNALNKHYYTYAVRSAFVADRYDVYPLPGRTLYLSAELMLP